MKSEKVQKLIWFEKESLDFLKAKADKINVPLSSFIKMKLFEEDGNARKRK